MRCSKCGFENPAGTKFCGQCAAALALVCPNCQADNPPGFKFCGQCATTLEPAISAPAPAKSFVNVGEADDTSALDGERKTVTVLFADIKGSMELIEDLDPEEARAIVDPALKLMIDAVQHYSGYVAQSTGDGIFALFGAPIAHEDHPQRALLAAFQMQQELKRYSDRSRAEGRLPIQARIGVNTGEVVVRTIKTGGGHTDYVPIGHSTSLAARMQALAPIGSIATTEQVRKLCDGYFAFAALGPTKVKGVSEPVNVYEVTGLGPLRTRLQRSAARGYAKFVGRQREMETLEHAAELAQAGHGQIVAAVAEPGLGKSRLFFEFKEKNQSGWMVLEAFSVSHGKATAYMPVLDFLHSYFKITSDDDARSRREKVAGKITVLDRSLEETLPYLFALLGIVEGEDALWQMDTQVKKRRTLDAIKRILLRESLNQPLIVMFEDLHWIDGETQAFLDLLADSIPSARILTLLNYRPEYTHQWSSRTYYTQLRLDPLRPETAGDLLNGLIGEGALLAPLKEMIVQRTEGNPFFMEEMVQVLFDEGALARNGTVKLVKPLSAIRLPSTVKGIIAARIDKLAPAEKDLLQTLAVVGKEFPLALVRHVSGKSNQALTPLLSNLQFSEFIYEQPAAPEPDYTFKHALTQEVAYDSILTERRKAIHERAAAGIETIFGAQLDDHLDELANHYSRSGNPAKAVEFLERAATRAHARSAYAEAERYLTQAISLIAQLPDTPDRVRREIALRVQYGGIFAALHGFATGELDTQLERTRELISRAGESPEIQMVLNSMWNVEISRGEFKAAATTAQRMLAIAENAGAESAVADARHALGATEMWRGNLVPARDHFERAAAIYNADLEHYLPMPSAGVIPGRGHLAWTLWALGYPEKARACVGEALSLARRLNRPYSMAFALQFAIAAEALCGDYAQIRSQSEALIELSQQHGYPHWLASGKMSLGATIVVEEDFDRGIALMREGMAGTREYGTLAVYRYGLVLMAGTLLRAGNVEEGLRALDEAAEGIEADERFNEAEIWRLRGEGMLAQRQERPAAENFRRAIAVARAQQGKSWALRATLSLARMLASQDHATDALATLAPVYGWFTEGFDTADLKEAKALLDELRDRQ